MSLFLNLDYKYKLKFYFLHCELHGLLWCYIHSKAYIYMRLVLLLQTCTKNRIPLYFIRNLITKQGLESKNSLVVMAVRYCLTLNAFVNFSCSDKGIFKSSSILHSQIHFYNSQPHF